MTLRPRLLVAPLAVVAVVGTAFVAGDHGGGTGGGDPQAAAGASSSGGAEPSSQRIVTAEEFCDGFGTLAVAQQAVLTSASPESIRSLKEAASTVGDLAPGTDMSDTARAGVDFVVTAFLGLEDDATAQDLVESDDAASVADDSHAQALAAWIGDSCQRPALSQSR